MNTNHTRLIKIACCVLLVSAAGCKPKFTGTSYISASNGDRSVNVIAEGPASVSRQPDRLTVTLSGHELVIEKERLLVDKKETSKVPANAKKFEVIFKPKMLTVTGDGAELLRMPFN